MYDLFYRDRRLLVLVLAMIVVGGLSSIFVLPRLEDPILRQRAALIQTSFPGASAVRVETLVTEELEQALKEIEEIRIIRSASRDEASTVTLELEDYVFDVDSVWSRVRDKLNDVAARLPPGASPPRFVDLKFTAYSALLSLTWTRDRSPNAAVMDRYAELLEQRLRVLQGTDDVDLFGIAGEEIVVEVNQQDLAARGITIDDVASALAASDARVSAGGLHGSRSDRVVEVESEFGTLDRISATPIQVGGGSAVVALRDIATVQKAARDPPDTLTRVDGRPAIVLGCFIQPDFRIDLWTDDLNRLLAGFRDELPEGVRLDTVFLQNDYVTRRLSNLLVTMAAAAAAVALVILVMMGWRSAIIVGTSLPLTTLIVLGGLRLLSIPLHQMSITGLIIALGLLIDNAIVAVDEMRKQMRTGLAPAGAIRATIGHLAVPLAGSTFTTCLAFAPLALMPGPAGEFVGSIGISVILAVTASLFVSLTIIPALTGILRGRITDSTKQGVFQFGAGSEALYRAYGRVLDAVFRRPVWTLAIGITLPMLGFLALGALPEQFFPSSDRNQCNITLQLPAAASIDETSRVAARIRAEMLKEPGVRQVHWFIGESAPAFYYNMLPVRSALPNYAQAMVQLDRGVNVTELVQRAQARLEGQFPSAHVIVRQLEQGPPVDAPIMIRVFGPELDSLRQIGRELRLIASRVPDVLTTVSDVESPAGRMSLRVNEDQARIAGLSHLNIAGQLSAALDGVEGGSLVESTEVLPLRIRLGSEQRESRDDLESFDLVARDEQGTHPVPVNAIARWELIPGDGTIERINGFRMNEIQVHVRAGVLPSDVLAKFTKRLAASGLALPRGYSIDYAGESAERNRAVGNLLASVGVLGVLMLAGLVLAFKSFRMAALIGLVGVLSAGLGLASLWFFGYPFGFMAIVGIMGLVGIAINDSIVVLAALRSDPAARAGDRDATRKVVFRATRHVISTTLTTIAGFTPLLIAGGGFWPPLAVSIAGGVTGATLLALFLVPSAMLLLFRVRHPADSDGQITYSA